MLCMDSSSLIIIGVKNELLLFDSINVMALGYLWYRLQKLFCMTIYFRNIYGMGCVILSGFVDISTMDKFHLLQASVIYINITDKEKLLI